MLGENNYRKERAAGKAGSRNGQALIEYAFMMPFLFLLIVNTINFGAFIYTWIEVANAARTGVQLAILNSASAGNLTPASGAQISAVITNDMASLPGTPTVAVCQDNHSTGSAVITTLSGTCPGECASGANPPGCIPADPEPSFYVSTMVDVTYNYVPLTGALSFPRLGIYATIPPTTVRRCAVMRLIR